MPRDIDGLIDDIDRLVDEQLADGPVDDYSVNRYDKCWHCGRDWHGMAITERIEAMRVRRSYDQTYTIADDDSPVICPGSDFIGPRPAPALLTPNTTPGFRITGRMIGCPTVPVVHSGIIFRTEVRDRSVWSPESYRRLLTDVLAEMSVEVELWGGWCDELPLQTLEVRGRRSTTVLDDDQLHRSGRRERVRLKARAQQQSIAAADRKALLDRYRTRMQEMTQ